VLIIGLPGYGGAKATPSEAGIYRTSSRLGTSSPENGKSPGRRIIIVGSRSAAAGGRAGEPRLKPDGESCSRSRSPRSRAMAARCWPMVQVSWCGKQLDSLKRIAGIADTAVMCTAAPDESCPSRTARSCSPPRRNPKHDSTSSPRWANQTWQVGGEAGI